MDSRLVEASLLDTGRRRCSTTPDPDIESTCRVVSGGRLSPGLAARVTQELSRRRRWRSPVRLDVDRILSRAAAILEEGQTPPDALTVLSAGDLLPGWYEDWVMLHRERLHQLQLHALEHLAALLTRDGDYHRALQAGLTAVRLNPLRESAHRVVAQVHLAEGNICEAIRQYEQCRHILANELGIVPTRHFRELLAPHLAAHTTPPSPVAASGSRLS